MTDPMTLPLYPMNRESYPWPELIQVEEDGRCGFAAALAGYARSLLRSLRPDGRLPLTRWRK